MATQAYVTIEGQKQGKFKGGATPAKPWSIAVLSIDVGQESPRDPKSGMASGKRPWKPVVIRKAVDSSSAQLYQAMCTNETLTNVTIEFVKAAPNGQELVYDTISIKNGKIIKVQRQPGMTNGHSQLTWQESIWLAADVENAHELTLWSLVYQKIAISLKHGSKSATDDWTP